MNTEEIELRSVELPNGTIINDVPSNITKAQLKDKLLSSGQFTEKDFIPVPKPMEEEQEDPSWAVKNLDLILGTGASLAPVLMMTNPITAGLYSIGAGAIGTGLGSLLTDELTEDEKAWADSVHDALSKSGYSIATDVVLNAVTKGTVGTFIKAKKALGYTPDEFAREVAEGVANKAGTKESFEASQEILKRTNATLTPYQVGAGGRHVLMEQIANIGLLSGKTMENNAAAVNKSVQEELTSIMDKYATNIPSDPSAMGKELFEVINAGKIAAQDSYGEGLVKVASSLRNQHAIRTVSSKPLQNFVEKYLAEHQRALGSNLTDETISFINNQVIKKLGDPKLLPASHLLDFDKTLNAALSTKLGTEQLYGTPVERQLADFANDFREVILQQLTKSSPEAAKAYKTLKASYAEVRENLVPIPGQTFIQNASKENYESLGNVIAQSGSSVDRIRALQKSVNAAFKAIGTRTDLPTKFIGPEEAHALIRRGFLENTFKGIREEGFDLHKVGTSLGNQLKTPKQQARWKAILGPEYKQVKQVVNLMTEASSKPLSNIGELFIRSREYSALATGAGLFGAAGISEASPVGAAAAAATILLGPVIMAKLVTNPKTVNKLITLGNQKFTSSDRLAAGIMAIVKDVTANMSEEERLIARTKERLGI